MTNRRINGSNTTPAYDGEDSSVFTIKLHIGGNLVWKPKVEYKDGFMEYFDHFNCDEGSLLDLRRMVKQLRFCDKKVQFWVKVKGLSLEVPANKELDMYVEYMYDDQWDYEVEISRSLGNDALLTEEEDDGSEQHSEREVEGPNTMFQEVDVEVNGPTSKQVENEGNVEIDEVDCVHSEEIFRSLDGSYSERECNGPENVFQERNLKKDGFKFVLGMIFRLASEFKWAVKYHETMRRKDVKFIKNEGRRVRECCRHSDICNCTIFGSRSNPRCPFQIKTYNPEHTCGDQDENKTVSSGFLAKLYKDDFRVNIDWGRRQFQEHVKQKLHCQMSKHQAYRAKHKVKKELDGQDSDQFTLLNDYCEDLRRSNPRLKGRLRLQAKLRLNFRMRLKGRMRLKAKMSLKGILKTYKLKHKSLHLYLMKCFLICFSSSFFTGVRRFTARLLSLFENNDDELKDLKSRVVGVVGGPGVSMRRAVEASWSLRRRRYWVWATSCHGRQQQALGIDVTTVGSDAQRTWVMVFGAAGGCCCLFLASSSTAVDDGTEKRRIDGGEAGFRQRPASSPPFGDDGAMTATIGRLWRRDEDGGGVLWSPSSLFQAVPSLHLPGLLPCRRWRWFSGNLQAVSSLLLPGLLPCRRWRWFSSNALEGDGHWMESKKYEELQRVKDLEDRKVARVEEWKGQSYRVVGIQRVLSARKLTIKRRKESYKIQDQAQTLGNEK
nr:Zinc knuckle family protein [Ipomoea batatas]